MWVSGVFTPKYSRKISKRGPGFHLKFYKYVHSSTEFWQQPKSQAEKNKKQWKEISRCFSAPGWQRGIRRETVRGNNHRRFHGRYVQTCFRKGRKTWYPLSFNTSTEHKDFLFLWIWPLLPWNFCIFLMIAHKNTVSHSHTFNRTCLQAQSKVTGDCEADPCTAASLHRALFLLNFAVFVVCIYTHLTEQQNGIKSSLTVIMVLL